MELDKFHVGYTTTCPPRNGNAVSSTNIRITGVEVNFAGTTCCQDGKFCLKDLYLVIDLIIDIGPQALITCQSRFFGSDQVNSRVKFEKLDVGMRSDTTLQCIFNLFSG